jgi:CBS domain-containing protein
MRSGVASVAPGDRLSKAAELMTHLAVRELPVVEEGTLVGIVTRSDLEPHVGQLEWTPVRMAMTSPATTVEPDASLGTVARVLIDGRFNGVPVAVDRTLAGMISRQDLLRAIAAPR